MRDEAMRQPSRSDRARPSSASLRPARGRVLTIVGPDGSGKTTLTDALARQTLTDGPVLLLAHRSGARRPGLLPHRKVRGPTTEPHRHQPYPAAVSYVKTLYVWADFVLGWAVRVRPFARRGGSVIIERGWWDTAVDPRRYRLREAPRLVRVLGRLMPASDLVVVLEASPEVIRSRKAQLSVQELKRQRLAWHDLLPPKQPRVYLDASQPAPDVLRAVTEHADHLAGSPRLSDKPGGESLQVDTDVSALWLPLLRRLTELSPDFVVWKNADSALRGVGDVDVVAPASDWDLIAGEFQMWAVERGLEPVLECRHVPGSMFLLATDQRKQTLHQLDVKERGTHRGSTVFRPEDLKPMTQMDQRGFRRLRPGAEGLFKLVLNSVKRDGRPIAERIRRERVPELLGEDPAGVRLAARLFGPFELAIRRVAERAAQNGWDRRAMLKVEGWTRLRAFGEPSILARRTWVRLAGKQCSGVKGMVNRGRLVPEQSKTWPEQLVQTHLPTPGWLRAGGVVMIAGPDGTGKTTLSMALEKGIFANVPVRRVHHTHGLGVLPHRTFAPGSSTEPHRHPVYPAWLSLIKWFYLLVDFQVGWTLRIRPFVRRGGWVLMQRSWWDSQVDPRRYRLPPAPGLVKFLGRLLPRPDLSLVLEAPPTVIRDRKTELPLDELERQMRAWRELLPGDQRTYYLDASLPADEVLKLAEKHTAGSWKSRSVPHRGTRSAGLPWHRRPRWILPTAPRHLAKSGLNVYQPVTFKGRAGWELARLTASVGLFRLLPTGTPSPDGIGTALAPHVPPGGAIAISRTNHIGRYVALVLGPDGSCIAAAKLATDPESRESLRREAANLAALGPFLPPPVSAPAILQQDEGLLLLEAIDWRPRPFPWKIHPDVAFALGSFFRAGTNGGEAPTGLAHGDVAPWNLFRAGEGWVLFDWEEARPDAQPFHDIAHHLVQASALLGRPSPRAILAGLEGKGWVAESIRAYGRGAGIPAADAPVYFVDYLRTSLETLDLASQDGRKGARTRRRLLRDLTRPGEQQ
jgi:thymidylate kinase